MNANNQPANPIANVGRQQQQARPRAGNNAAQYTSTEIQGLLQVIEEILPVHGEDWEEVSQAHAANFPNMLRNAESIKRKYDIIIFIYKTYYSSKY